MRRRRDGYFETLEWSLTTEEGAVVHLLGAKGASDPMGKGQQYIPGQEGGVELGGTLGVDAEVSVELESVTRSGGL